MPLTIAHAAAAWPLRRWLPRLPLAALVIGSMSPDFEYLVRVAPRGHFGHEPLGLVTFCLPTSLLVWALYEGLVRPALLSLLPVGVQAACTPRHGRPGWQPLAWATLAALLGALTHVGWDLLTHERGLADLAIPALRGQVAPATLGDLRWYQLLQHVSTAVGLVAVGLWARSAWLRFPSQARRFSTAEKRRAVLATMTFAATGAFGAVLNGARVWGRGPRSLLSYAAVGGMLALALALIAYAVFARSAVRQVRQGDPRRHVPNGLRQGDADRPPARPGF